MRGSTVPATTTASQLPSREETQLQSWGKSFPPQLPFFYYFYY